MRSRKALINTLVAFCLELVSIVSSFIIPRLILSHYGSYYNGLLSSITQFLSFASLFQFGIGGVTRAALYRPLAEHDYNSISSIVNATKAFMKKMAILYMIYVVIYAVIFSTKLASNIAFSYVIALIFVTSINLFANYFLGITWQILLSADQRQYITSLLRILCIILSTIISIVLISINRSLIEVKLFSSIAFLISPLILGMYVNKNYKLNNMIPGDNRAISQRWDSFAHQIANFVHDNTDIVIISIFMTFEEVSVYSVYALVMTGVKKIIMNITVGIEAAFGNMLAKNQNQTFKESFFMFEFVIFCVSGICFSSAIVLCIPFVFIYTKNISDTNYLRWNVALLFSIAELFGCVRLPAQIATKAMGKYRETRNGAILEPIINIMISVALVPRLGIIGVIFGTLVAMTFRTIQYVLFAYKKILMESTFLFLKRMSLLCVCVLCSCFIALQIDLNVNNYFDFILLAIVRFSIVTIIFLVFSITFEKDTIVKLLRKIPRSFNNNGNE